MGQSNDTDPWDPAGKTTLRFVFRSHELSVRRALRSVTEELRRFELTPDTVQKAELVLAEVLNNVVEHSYADNRDGKIELRIFRADGTLACEVCDQGIPMPGGIPAVSGKPWVRCLPDDLPEGGFGWPLICSLAENLRYSRCAGCNRLTFCLTDA